MGLDLWGCLVVTKSLLPDDLDEQRRIIHDQCREARFTWNDQAFAKFRDAARAFTARGVKVLIFTTPMHPLTKDTPAADPDGTSHEGFLEVVRHMEEFDKDTPGLWFRDFHKDGVHDFLADEFYDVDHLNKKGTGRLGTMIQAWMAECGSGEGSGVTGSATAK
jgi:hypothetical protein